MKIREMALSSYYHQYLVIEADDLTEICRDIVKVNEDDCYALCSAFCDPDGLLMFNILAIGPSADNCVKGLDTAGMLGVLTMNEVFECEAQLIEPSAAAMQKSEPFVGEAEMDTDDDLIAARMDWRLDDIRDVFYPDDLLVGIITDGIINEYSAHIEGIYGPFLKCSLTEDTDSGLMEGDILYAFPYHDDEDDTCRMYAMFNGRRMNHEEKTAFERILSMSDKYGITFKGRTIRS